MALSHEQWLKRLLSKFQVDVAERQHWNALYDSRQARPMPMPNYRDAYKRILSMSRTPWARLVVDLTEERIQVQGFSVGGAEDSNDLIWSLFKRSHMEALQAQAHREALATGTSYVSVWPDANDMPKMAYESSLSVTHETTPGDPHTVAAAIKLWFDSIAGRIRCNLYLPNEVVKFVSQGEVTQQTYSSAMVSLPNAQFSLMETVRHDYSIVPIIPFLTRPDWRGYGRSDLTDIEETISRIEYLTANTLLAVELGALRQKWATGLEIPTDPDSGQAVEPFKVALDRLWVSEDPDTKFGSFSETDIRPYLSAISDAVGQLSAVSRVPATYMVQNELSNPPSAASLEASETGLINKVRDRQARYAESWENVARVALQIAGGTDLPDDLTNLSVQWADPRTRSDSQVLDAATKMHSIEVPWSAIMEFIGYTPDQIREMEQQRAADTFQRLLSGAIPQQQAPPVELRPNPSLNGNG